MARLRDFGGAVKARRYTWGGFEFSGVDGAVTASIIIGSGHFYPRGIRSGRLWSCDSCSRDLERSAWS